MKARLLALSLALGSLHAEEPSTSEPPRGRPAAAISGNPAVENVVPGNGLAGQWLHLPADRGLRLGGVWLADTNGLISGGAQPGKWSWNSALIVGANLDLEKFVGWKGASLGVQFLQFDGQDTNGQAGSVQGYNSLPGPEPLHRSELYQLWFRQSLFDDRIVVRVGKMVPTYDFNNVARPVSTRDAALSIPAVTGLLYTPVFVNPTLLGAIGGYYNSVCGVTVTLAPTENTYLSYGIYDGNVARGVQTGMMGPTFNGYSFQIGEAGVDWVIGEKYPGNFSAGLWYQSGLLQGPPGATDDGVGGFYLFGTQRIWGHITGATPDDGGKTGTGKEKTFTEPALDRNSSISAFYQFGVNNSETLPMNQYFGFGLTGFGLVPKRPADSAGVGMSWAWLNDREFQRPSELMFQAYYQAHIIAGTFLQPAVTYIPTPGAGPNLGGAWAITLRATVLF